MQDERTDWVIDAIQGLGQDADEPFAELILEGVRRRLGLTDEPLRVDRFVLGQTLGAGGMGVVYAAEDPRLERRVALKLLTVSGPEGAARGLREARALARLSHPNVVAVYEAGTHEGKVFVAMELVEGQTLRQWLAAPRSWRELCTVMLAAGRGLAAAHAVGIVHRDFKPDNVLVGDRVRVADFGLAQELDERPTVRGSAATTTGSGGDTTGRRGSGTASFMSPEQLRGEPVDARTDQFAFCATMVLALTGRPAFEGGTVEERLEAIERGLPSDRLAGVPRGLRAMLERGLRARPDARYPRLDELLDALERRLRPRRWIGATVATAAVIGAIAFTGWSAKRRDSECRKAARAIDEVWSEERRHAMAAAFEATKKPYAGHASAFVEASLDRHVAEWADARVDACRAEQAGRTSSRQVDCLQRRRGELDALLAQLVPVAGQPADAQVVQRATQVVSALPPPRECARPEAMDEPAELDDQVQLELDGAHEQLAQAWALSQVGRYAQGRDVVEPLIPRLRTLGHRPTLAKALLQHGRIITRLGEHEAAHRSLREALRLGLAVRADRIAAHAGAALCEELTGQGELVRAHEAAEIAATMHERLTGEPVWPLLANVRGGLLIREGRDAEAVEVLAEGIAACDADDPTALPDLVSMYGNQAAALLRVGRLDEAEVASERSIELARRLIGEEHPMFAVAMIVSASIRNDRDDPAGALRLQQQALEIWQRAVPEPTPVTASMLYNRGIFALELDRYDEALASMQEALELWERLLPPGHSRLSMAHTGLGSVRREQGQLELALEHHERALELVRAELERDEPSAGHPLLEAARTALVAGQLERAEHWIEQGLRIYARTPNPVMEGELRFQRARALAERGESDEARQQAQAALGLLRGAEIKMAREVEAWLAEHG